MHFDVTNGVQTLRDLRLDFVVIPATLILASTTILVNEGKLNRTNWIYVYVHNPAFSMTAQIELIKVFRLSTEYYQTHFAQRDK